MSSYLVVKNSTNTLSYPCKTTHTGNPYLKVDTGYLDLTTETTTGTYVVVKSGTSSYRPKRTTTSTQDTSYIASYYSYRSYETTSTYISEPTGTSLYQNFFTLESYTPYVTLNNTTRSGNTFNSTEWISHSFNALRCSSIHSSILEATRTVSSGKYATFSDGFNGGYGMIYFQNSLNTETNYYVSYIFDYRLTNDNGAFISTFNITSSEPIQTTSMYGYRGANSQYTTVSFWKINDNETPYVVNIKRYWSKGSSNPSLVTSLKRVYMFVTEKMTTTGYYIPMYNFTGGETITTTNSLQTTYGSLLYSTNSQGSVSSWTSTQSTDSRQGVVRYSSTTENITRESTYITEY